LFITFHTASQHQQNIFFFKPGSKIQPFQLPSFEFYTIYKDVDQVETINIAEYCLLQFEQTQAFELCFKQSFTTGIKIVKIDLSSLLILSFKFSLMIVE
jgi:hypothetical protein